MIITAEEKRELLKIARKSIEWIVVENTPYQPETSSVEGIPNQAGSAFVSIYYRNKLRGCIGQFQSSKPLFQLVALLSRMAATEDHRFYPIRIDELGELTIEISILTPLKKISSVDEIEIGKHGILIRKDEKQGTLLPQVATNRNWDKLKFVEFCSKNKTQIGTHGWKKAELYTFETIVIKEA